MVSLYFIIGFIEIVHWVLIKGPITISSLLVLSNSNVQEALEFVDTKGTLGLLVLIPYVFLFVASLRNRPIIDDTRNQYRTIGIVLTLSVVFITENLMGGRFIRRATPQVVRVTHAFLGEMTVYSEALKNRTPRSLASVYSENDQQTFVLILGESCSRRHMSLYGGLRKTNPKLENRSDIVIYNDAVAAYSNTVGAILSMLTETNLENNITLDQSIDLIDVFHSAGFDTYWISNQSPVGVWENTVTAFSRKSDHCKFLNISGNTSFETSITSSYDAKLFEPFLEVLARKEPKKFIVLHLMGSHTSYWKRYPKEYDHFKGKGSKEETIAEYDNSILYNDYIVDSLLNTVRQSIDMGNNQITSVIYIADHGENVYDEYDKVGHDFAGILPKANVEVPFLVWLSPAYIEKNSLKYKTINTHKDMPFVSDDLFHSIIDLNGIKGSVLNEKRSIFSEHYNQYRKRILENGEDYDNN